MDDVKIIEEFLAIDFEKYICLSDYKAICSYSEGIIESRVQSLTGISSRILYRRLFGRNVSDKDISKISLELISDIKPKVKIVLSEVSENLRLLSPSYDAKPQFSLKIENIEVNRHNDAQKLLSRLAKSLFFQIEMFTGYPLALERRRSVITRRRMRKAGFNISDIEFPKYEFDDKPLSIYFYGCSAQGMPLLEFLAYYQVLEYYFPVYAQAEAIRKIKKIIKDPTFRTDRDSHIGKIFSALPFKGQSIGNEKFQLNATLNECVDPDRLYSFLTETKSRVDFFSKKHKKSSTQKLSLNKQSPDLISDVAHRIYDIRCKIVHTKSDPNVSENEIILPFSKEADQLIHDIVLVKYLAEQILIAASSPIKLS